MIYFIRNTQYLGWVSLQRYRNNCSLDDNRVSAQRARLKTELNIEMCDSMDFFSGFFKAGWTLIMLDHHQIPLIVYGWLLQINNQ